MQERKRNLDDEKKIRDKEKQAEVIKREISQLEEKTRGFNIETVMERRLELSKKMSELITKVSIVGLVCHGNQTFI